MTFIQTYSGKEFDVLKLSPESIDIEDIAHALSNTPRFAGHTKKFFSVAEHSVLVSKLVPTTQALMHDASEAYISDIPSPIKALLPDYKTLEKRIEKAIASKFGFDHKLSDEVKKADTKQLISEARHLMLTYPEWTEEEFYKDFEGGIRPLGVIPEAAKSLFLSRYEELK